ncbi:hypothetical protein D3C78_18830 [compost metagenome]
MKIKLSVQQALDISENCQFDEGTHVFSIHDGLELEPVKSIGGVLMVGEEIPLVELLGAHLFLSVRSLDKELLDIYSLKIFNTWYDEITPEQRDSLDTQFTAQVGISILDPYATEIISHFGYGNIIPTIAPLNNQAIDSIIDEFYEGEDIQSKLLVGEDTVFVLIKSGDSFEVYSHALSSIGIMNSRVIDNLSRMMEDLEKRKELHKQLERGLAVEKEVEMGVEL